MGGFDLIWNDGPIYADEFGLEQQKLNSFLGKHFVLLKLIKFNFFFVIQRMLK